MTDDDSAVQRGADARFLLRFARASPRAWPIRTFRPKDKANASSDCAFAFGAASTIVIFINKAIQRIVTGDIRVCVP